MFKDIFPRIPNLELGFLYNIGNNLRSGRLYADYLVPFRVSGDSLLFGEAHYENQDFWKRSGGETTYRQDLSLGGGVRRVFSDRAFLGLNGFFDTTRLFGQWYSSGGVGLEMVAVTPGEGAIELNFNWYGNLLNRSELVNALRNRAGSWDIEAALHQPLFHQAVDLRLNATAYDLNIGTPVYGWRAGAELTPKDGFFTLKYEHGYDRINGSYNTVGGYINVGFSLDNLIKGTSPFDAPQPVFGSPRNLKRLLTQKVRRNWHQPTAAVLTRPGGSNGGPNRFFASISMVDTVWPDVYESDGPNLVIPFDQSVPYSDLDPNKFITVELTYEFDQAPTSGNVDWNIFVVGSYGWIPFNFTQVTRSAGQSGHIVFMMDSGQPDYPQAAFTTMTTDPMGIGFQVGAPGTTWMKITNVTVHFNQ